VKIVKGAAGSSGKKLLRFRLGASSACCNGGQAVRPTFSQFSGIQMLVIASIVSLASYMLPFLFVLSLVVFFHELGHFLIGRWCGVKVETFSLVLGLSYLALMTAMAHAGASRRCRLEAMSGSTVTLTMPQRWKRRPWRRCLHRNGR
jgi:Peptidase family M50